MKAGQARGENDRQHEGVEDDRWIGKGEVDCQQGWRMTPGRAGVNMTVSRRGRG